MAQLCSLLKAALANDLCNKGTASAVPQSPQKKGGL
jgi:hypothetical protein